MPEELEKNNGDNIHKPYEPDITKGFTASIAPTKPAPPPPPPPSKRIQVGNDARSANMKNVEWR